MPASFLIPLLLLIIGGLGYLLYQNLEEQKSLILIAERRAAENVKLSQKIENLKTQLDERSAIEARKDKEHIATLIKELDHLKLDAQNKSDYIEKLENECDQAKIIQQRNIMLMEKYDPIISNETEQQRITEALKQMQTQYKKARRIIEQKIQEISLLNAEVENKNLIILIRDIGLHEPDFDLSDTVSYQKSILSVREQMKELVRAGKALKITGVKSVGISGPEKTALRAFNLECENALASVKWNNINRKVALIQKEAANIAKEHNDTGLEVAPAYKPAHGKPPCFSGGMSGCASLIFAEDSASTQDFSHVSA